MLGVWAEWVPIAVEGWHFIERVFAVEARWLRRSGINLETGVGR